MRWIIGLAAIACLGLAGCSQDAAPQAEETAAAKDTPASPATVGGITPQYLAGEWCYLRYEAGGEVSEENITYNFAADGTLKYQTNSGTPVDQDGSYDLEEGVVVIKPALAFFKFVPVTVGKDAMILEAMGSQSFWTRGACGQ